MKIKFCLHNYLDVIYFKLFHLVLVIYKFVKAMLLSFLSFKNCMLEWNQWVINELIIWINSYQGKVLLQSYVDLLLHPLPASSTNSKLLYMLCLMSPPLSHLYLLWEGHLSRMAQMHGTFMPAQCMLLFQVWAQLYKGESLF